MGRFFALTLLLSIACSDPPPATSAPPPPPSTAMPPAPLPEEPTWLYRVTTDTQPSYVFAALEGVPLHASLPADYAVLFHFARLVIVTDASTEEESEASTAMVGVDRAASLPGVVGPERFARLADALHGTVDASTLPHLRPTFALIALQTSLVAEAAGGRASDARTWPTHDAVTRRQLDGGALLGLYSQDDLHGEMRAMGSTSTSALNATLDHLDEDRAEAAEVVSHYRAGDEAAMTTALDHDAPGEEAIGRTSRERAAAGLDARFARLQTELRAGNAFAVLSIGMVLGEHGVLARLRANGTEITRVSVSPPVP